MKYFGRLKLFNYFSKNIFIFNIYLLLKNIFKFIKLYKRITNQ